MNIKLFLAALLLPLSAAAQTFDFDLTKHQPAYSDATGYGYDFTAAPDLPGQHDVYFSVKVPDGNYRVTVTIGSRRRATDTQLRAESRRLLVPSTVLKKKELRTYTFTINKRSPYITDKERVKINDREKGSLDWDDKLTLDWAGKNPAVSRIEIAPDTTATTVFLCGNSTVVDQSCDPWASWGQMITRWFGPEVAVSNNAESGLTAGSFLRQNRLDKVLAMLRPGDYVICEFGHNDQKEKGPGAGAWYNFSYNLKQYIDRVRKAGGRIIFCTPTQRRFFKDGKIQETHGDYPDAMRAVARRENVPVVELHDMTRTFFETLGVDDSKRALVHYPAGTFPGQTRELADNTHFNPYGAYEVARMVTTGLKNLGIPLTRYLTADWKTYDPAHPDDFRTFVWFPSKFFDNVKPAGN